MNKSSSEPPFYLFFSPRDHPGEAAAAARVSVCRGFLMFGPFCYAIRVWLEEFWKDQILQGSYLTKQVVVNYGWYDNVAWKIEIRLVTSASLLVTSALLVVTRS